MRRPSKTARPRRDVNPESGLALVIVITILAALLAGGAVALSLQLGSTREARTVKSSKSAMFCAESGLVEAREQLESAWAVRMNILDLDNSNNPTWYPFGSAFTGDIDDPPDGIPDYQVTIEDDQDGDGDPTIDANRRIFLRSRCTKFSESPAEVLEIMEMPDTGYTYRNQAGQGPGNSGNANE